MAGDSTYVGTYSPVTGFVFLFNLIVGAGALTIPHAFAQVGLLYGLGALCLLGLVSYVSATFVIEAIAGVNALRRLSNPPVLTKQGSLTMVLSGASQAVDEASEAVPFLTHTEEEEGYVAGLRFDISEKIEIAAMAQELFSRKGLAAFYACVAAYLYGDLAIYAVAIPKSLREVICPRPSSNAAVWECPNVAMNSAQLYRILVVVFGLTLGSFAFGHMQKTQCIQLITTVMRHASFALMIILAFVGIGRGEGRPIADVVAHEDITSLPNFFGVCIYSFMCHHSIPGIIAPISKKRSVGLVLLYAFVAVMIVYVVLSISATFRFQPADIQDVYTLNFNDYPVRFIAYFLSLFPVFTLSTTFPIICITLRENLHTLFKGEPNSPASNRHCSPTTLFAIAAVVPPLLVALCTEDVGMLVGITGAYAGLGIQWVIPAAFVYCLRQRLVLLQTQLKLSSLPKNPYASPFGKMVWLYLTFALSAVSLVVITYTRLFK
ncbi:hypothetical protein SPRG_11931 [Saprolegnia parasitica CBS 223.65]|uniref:Amino acid transporter transmembrane domain-containing protein n=1 Tax=Saprolegnia parasitica (strain CBS 223.65) TaxID=695850 RepID=A0A067C8F4_SAPPC|nr:hypothetical protein SPRG_11931 [Saprolegnia parasitica CBS 223.65]KDO23087.1 hypothetical protein SPRG_11931 [Saprolegnia parasitica CBS 223.65]|eukprot:XP_012206199.1 hypothetical protein SPRG_11931 [Saprolegnia parasitica CBS 223.65]